MGSSITLSHLRSVEVLCATTIIVFFLFNFNIEFITSFSVVLDEFWQNAGAFEKESEWLESLGYLERNIPWLTPNKVGLSEALNEMQNLNLELEKATVEVRNY